MNTPRRGPGVTFKLLVFLSITALAGIGLQTWLALSEAQGRNEQDVAARLTTLHSSYSDEIQILERASATLSTSFAGREDLQQLFLARDREGLLDLLTPVFDVLRTEYNIAHLYVEEPSGVVYVGIHRPDQYGDDITYRRTAAAALQSQRTVAGVEIGPSHLGIRSVSPMFYRGDTGSPGEFIGMVEVGLDYDQPFLEDLKARSGADFRMWATYEAAEPAGLSPAGGVLESPSSEFFFYAGTDTTALPIDEQVYLDVIESGETEIQFISAGGQELAVLVAPLLAYGDRAIGIVEIVISRAEALAALQESQVITLMASGALALAAFAVLAVAINRIVLRPLNHLTAVAQLQSRGDLEARADIVSGDEFGQLGHILNTLVEELDSTLQGLEHTIQSRTGDLEQRSRQLEASVEVARAATSILDTDHLIQQAVELIRDRFGLYYVGLFLVDEAQEWAVLQAATGTGGQALLDRRHRLQIGEGSMIGWSIANRQARVALEAVDDAVRLATPELPETRSEAALPLHSRGEIIGALSVQSTEPGAFDEETIAVLQTMADQVAIALANARLFAQSQEALETARKAYGEITGEAWAELLRARSEWGYLYTQETVVPTDGDWRQDMLRAAQTGQAALGNDDRSPSLSIPVRVRDQVVGVLGFRRETTRNWSDEEIALLETLADQVGTALESARAYQETQRRAAREQLTSEVSGRIRETLDLDTILQTAAQGIREALGLQEVSIELGTSGGNDQPQQGKETD